MSLSVHSTLMETMQPSRSDRFVIWRTGETILTYVHLTNGKVMRGWEWKSKGLSTHQWRDFHWVHGFTRSSDMPQADLLLADDDKVSDWDSKSTPIKALWSRCNHRERDYLSIEAAVSEIARHSLDQRIHWDLFFTSHRAHEHVTSTTRPTVCFRENNEHLLVRIQRAAGAQSPAVVTAEASANCGNAIRLEDLQKLFVRQNQLLDNYSESPLIFSGPMKVVMAGKVAALLLHEIIGHTLESISARDGIFSDIHTFPHMHESVSVSDLAGMNDSYVYVECDQEGTRAEDFTLIKDGSLKALPATIISNGPFSGKLYGNARANSIESTPQPRSRNLVMAQGEMSFEHVIDNCDRGIFALIPAFAAFASCERDIFWLDIEQGWHIIGGRLGQPTPPFAVTGRISRLIRDIRPLKGRTDTLQAFCTKNGQSVPVSMVSPPIFVPELEVVPLPRHPLLFVGC